MKIADSIPAEFVQVVHLRGKASTNAAYVLSITRIDAAHYTICVFTQKRGIEARYTGEVDFAEAIAELAVLLG